MDSYATACTESAISGLQAMMAENADGFIICPGILWPVVHGLWRSWIQRQHYLVLHDCPVYYLIAQQTPWLQVGLGPLRKVQRC